MRIGIDTLFETPGKGTGGITYLGNFIRALASIDNTNEYFIFTSPLMMEIFRGFKKEKFHFVMCPYSNEKRIRRVLTQHTLLPILARKYKLDILNSPGNVAPIYVPCASVLTIKTMHHYRTPFQIDKGSLVYRRIMVKYSAKRADMIIANSKSNLRDICHFLGVKEDKVAIVPEAVNNMNFRPLNEREISEAIGKWKIRRPYILFVSALWPYKNALGLIKAFHILVHKYRVPHTLVIVGSGWESYKNKIIQEAKKGKVLDRIAFLGHIPNTQLNPIYSGSDVFVYPSLYETFGLTVLEAMASGTPVVASNRASLPEIVGDAGVLADPTNPDVLAEAIFKVISDENLRSQLIQKGLERAKKFTWERTARETLKVYKKAFEMFKARKQS